MNIRKVHRLKRTDSLEGLSARYQVPVCMIMRANGLTRAEDYRQYRALMIPCMGYCMHNTRQHRKQRV